MSTYRKIGIVIVLCALAFCIGNLLPRLNILAQGKTTSTDKGPLKPHDTPNISKKSITEVAKFTIPSTVNITTRRQPQMMGTFIGSLEEKAWSMGTGIIIDKKGYILTNAHVVGDAKDDKVSITLFDRRKIIGTVKGKDSRTDIAVVLMDEPPADLLPAILGDSDKVEVGEWVVAVGNPHGFWNTVTAGIVSAPKQESPEPRFPYTYIQTDAPINPGNSGGPLINLRGEVIGINSWIAGGTGSIGLGFAIPINRAKMIMEELIKNGKASHPYLGLGVAEIDENLASFYYYKNLKAFLEALKLNSNKGVYVTQIEDNSPAAKAGFHKEADVIIEIDGQKVESGLDYKIITEKLRPDKSIDIKIIRDGKQQTLKLTVGNK